MKKPDYYKYAAALCAVLLTILVIFGLGLFTAQTQGYERALKDILSGTVGAELRPYAQSPLDARLTVWKTKSDALDGGALLIGSHYSQNPALFLVDENGKVLRQWRVERRLFNTSIKSWWKEPFEPQIFAVDDAHLLPGGDVIFTQDLRDLANYRGQRLARMDANSHIIWQIADAFHHEFDIAGNPQRIYAMTSRMLESLPMIGPKAAKVRYLEDWIESYTLDGKKTGEWSVVDAFIKSPYRNLLTSLNIDLPEVQRVEMDDGRVLYDMLHLDSVQYLDVLQAKAIPFAQEGDLLLSLRGMNALAVLRPATGQIVWVGFGPWEHQHHAHVGEDGKLYIYDNEGSHAFEASSEGTLQTKIQSRVIRFNPFNNQMDEIYASPELRSYWRGYYHPLKNNYWLIDSSEQSRVVVISPEKKVVWELRGVPFREAYAIPYRKQISTVRYYSAEELKTFNLKPSP